MASERAHQIAEIFLRQRLIVREFTINLKAGSAWQRLPERPVLTIGGDLAIAVDIDSDGGGWVRTPDRDCKITYDAGMARCFEALPESIKVALGDLTLHLERGGSPENLPPRVAALLRPYQHRPRADQ